MTLKHDQGFFELDRPANMAVSQYEGPGEFWLIPCLDAVTETLEFLSKKLKKYGGKYKVSEGIREGQIFSVNWDSRHHFGHNKLDQYYRGEILAITASKIHPTTNDYLVKLIDYGKQVTLTRNQIFRLPHQELSDIPPPQAIRCCLKTWHLSNGKILDGEAGDLECIDSKFKERLWNYSKFYLQESITVILHKNPKILSCPDAPKYEANLFDTEKLANDYFEANQPAIRRSPSQPQKLTVAEWLLKNNSSTISSDDSLVVIGDKYSSNQPHYKVIEWLRKNNLDSDNFNQNNDEERGRNTQKSSNPNSTTSTDEIIKEFMKNDEEKDVKLPEIENNFDLGITLCSSPKKATKQRPSVSEYSEELVCKRTEKTNVDVQGQVEAFVAGKEKNVNCSDKVMEKSQILDQNQDLVSRNVTESGISQLGTPNATRICKFYAKNGICGRKRSVCSFAHVDPKLKMINLELRPNYILKDGKWKLESSRSPSRSARNSKCSYSCPDEESKKSLQGVAASFDWNPMATDYISPHNKVDNFNNHQLFDINENNENKICKFYRYNGHCARGLNCQFLHVQNGMKYLDNTGDDVATIAHNEAQLPEVGRTSGIHIPTLRHPESFYINVFESDVDHEFAPAARSLNLAELVWKMSQHYNMENPVKSIVDDSKTLFTIGEIVAANSQHDQTWHRARIIEVFESDNHDLEYIGTQRVKVFFVDSGRSLIIDVTNVKKILNKFLILPFQAIECSLYNLCPQKKYAQFKSNNNNVWPKKSAETFLEMIQKAEDCSALKAKIMSKEGIKPEILVYVKIDKQWINIAEELVRLGLASESSSLAQCSSALRKTVVIPG